MKKILSLGIASALLATTAIYAAAEIAANDIAVAVDEVKADGTTTIVVTAAKDITGSAAFKVTATGLDMLLANGATCTMGTGLMGSSANPDGGDNTLNIGIISADTIPADTVLATISSVPVTAKAGEAFTVSVTGASGEALVTPVTGTVADGTVSDTSSDTTSSDGETSGDTSTDDSNTSGEASKPGDKDNPDTGIALAVVPAVLAGAAIVVAKKRK